MRRVLTLLVMSMAIVFFACENEDAEDVGGKSSISETSHNTGKDCLSCHKFTAAGSVYNKTLTSAFPGAEVKFTSQANGEGTILGTYTVNKSGSFYTNSTINYGSGIYVSVTGSSGNIKHMNTAITTGACNSCHGSSTSKVWAE